MRGNRGGFRRVFHSPIVRLRPPNPELADWRPQPMGVNKYAHGTLAERMLSQASGSAKVGPCRGGRERVGPALAGGMVATGAR